MSYLNVKNNAVTNLAAAITSAATSLTVTTGEGAKFPATNFPITINSEILLCTSRTGDVFTVLRGQYGTTAAPASIGNSVQLRIITEYITELQTGKANVDTLTNSQTGTAYTLVLSDVGKLVTMNNAAANTLTVPTNATVAFPVGTKIMIIQLGAGSTTIVGASGVTINASTSAPLTINEQYGSRGLIQISIDVWQNI